MCEPVPPIWWITKNNSRREIIDVLPGHIQQTSFWLLCLDFVMTTTLSSKKLILSTVVRLWHLRTYLAWYKGNCVLWIPYKSIDKENFIAFDDIYGEYNEHIILIWDLEVFKNGASRYFVQIFNESVSH